MFMHLSWYGTNSEGKPQTGLDYFDNLFNEVSKKSAFGPEAQQEQLKEADKLNGQTFKTSITMKGDQKAKYSPEDAAKTAVTLLNAAGLQATADGAKVKVEGDLGAMAKAVVTDSIAMYNNQGDVLQGKYGLNARQALFTWHQLLGSLSKSKDLASLKSLDAGSTLQAAQRNVIEPAYNYYGVEVAQGRGGMLTFAIVFYLVYTVWYGFGILYLFEGLGVNLSH
jgi:hypothetical protein